VEASISRLAPVVSGKVTRQAVGRVRRLMADYSGAEDLISVGAYHAGSSPAIDEAIAKRDLIERVLIQDVEEKIPVADTLRALGAIAGIPIPEEELAEP
jgi:flagellum-specific ATP synthase